MNDYIVKMEGIKGFGNCESSPVSKWMFHYDGESQKVDLLHLGGLMPYARAFVAAMVECPNIKEALSSYQQSYDFEREHLYSFDNYYGITGCQDIIVKNGSRVDGMDLISRKFLMRVTMYDKIDCKEFNFTIREVFQLADYFDVLQRDERTSVLEENKVKFIEAETIDDSFGKLPTIEF